MKHLPFWVACLLHSSLTLFGQTRDDYLKWMQQSLPAVPEWNEWQKKTGELPPDFAHMKKSNLLPDPLHFYDGQLVKNMTTDWPKRRTEIKQLFEKYVTGKFPPKPTINNVVLLDETQEDGYIVRNVRVEFGPQGKASVRIRLIIPDRIK